jgi:hypothetical protein
MTPPIPQDRQAERDEIAALLQEKLDDTEGMELPHGFYVLRTKVLSVISALRPAEEGGEVGAVHKQPNDRAASDASLGGPDLASSTERDDFRNRIASRSGFAPSLAASPDQPEGERWWVSSGSGFYGLEPPVDGRYWIEVVPASDLEAANARVVEDNREWALREERDSEDLRIKLRAAEKRAEEAEKERDALKGERDGSDWPGRDSFGRGWRWYAMKWKAAEKQAEEYREALEAIAAADPYRASSGVEIARHALSQEGPERKADPK